MALVRAAAVILLTGLLAGCAAPPDDADPRTTPTHSDWAARAVAHGGDHDHLDPSHHAGLSTPNFRVLGFDPLITDANGSSASEMYCGDVSTEGDRTFAVVHNKNAGIGFVLADVTEPTAPHKVGEFDLPTASTYDVAITPDGRYVVLSSFRVAATGASLHELMPAGSVLLVDVQDPANPVVVDVQAAPFYGPHSLSTARTADGVVWVLASTHNGYHATTYFSFYRLDESPSGPRLVPAGVLPAQSPDPGATWSLTNGHVDGEIQSHPVTGENLAYLATNNGGLLIARLDGAAVTPVGSWNDYAQDPRAESVASMTGRIHSTYPLPEPWDGRHYTIIGQENGGRLSDRPTGQVIVMDTTDPSLPRPVARWTLPVDPGPWGHPDEPRDRLLFSTHYFTVVDRTLFVALYHGGIWAVDLSPENWPELPSVGVFLPDRESPKPGDASGAQFFWSPTVLDVLRTPEGRLVTWDSRQGIYVIEFDPDAPVPPVEPWVEDAWIGSHTQ